MKTQQITLVVIASVFLGACAGTQTSDQSLSAPISTATNNASPTVTLNTNDGLMIFGSKADEYLDEDGSGLFSQAGPEEFSRVGTIMRAPESGKCFDAIIPFGAIDESTSMAVLTPSEIRCGYDGGESLPASTRTGVVKDGKFTPFSSTANLVPGDALRQAYDMTSDGRNVYWLETASTSLSHDEWRMFSADIMTGDSKLLLTAEDGLGLAGPLPVSAKTGLTFREGRLYFMGYFPTEQYYAKKEAGEIDPEGWEPGDFSQGLLSVKTDGTELAIAGDSIFDYGFTEDYISYVKLGSKTLSFPTPEGTREETEGEAPTHISLASEGTEEIIVEDHGSPDGSIHTENMIANFRVEGNIISFTRGLTAYVLNVKSRDVEVVDLTSPIELATKKAPLAESPVKISDFIHLDGRLALSVELESADDLEYFLIDYSVRSRSGTTYPTETKAYGFSSDGDEITFRLDDGDIATYLLEGRTP